MEFVPMSLSHRGSGLAFKELFLGEENTRENYSLNLGKQEDFFSPIHHHNYDQLRFAVKGNISLGPNMMLKEGQLSYHPEGAYYGPQEDDADHERQVLVLQCGGASGNGYMSFAQLQTANDQLSQIGKFEGGKYHGQDGTVKDGYQALWEHLNGKPMVYPKPRYKSPIVMDPASFSWLPVPVDLNDTSEGNSINGNVNVWKKTLGVFSERELKVEEIMVSPGGRIEVGSKQAIHLLVVLDGIGSVGSENLVQESTIRVKPGHAAKIIGDSGNLVLLHYEIPLLGASEN